MIAFNYNKKEQNSGKKLNKFFWTSIGVTLLFEIIRVLLMAFPEVSLTVIFYLVASVLIISGIFLIAKTENKLLYTSIFPVGIVSVILGTLIFCYPDIAASSMSVFIGVWFIISASSRMNFAMILKDKNKTSRILIIILSIVSIICGFLLIVLPGVGSIVITKYIGLLAIIYSVVDLIDLVIVRKNFKTLIKFFE